MVGRLALVTTAPWWLAGVVGGSSSAWADDGGRQWFSAALMIAAGFGLLLARLREPLDPLLGPPRLVPTSPASSPARRSPGAFSSLGPLSMTLTGYAGVLLANFSAAYLTGWRRGLFLPVALAAGVVMTAPVPGPARGRAAVVAALPAAAADRDPHGAGRRPPARDAAGGAADRDRLPGRARSCWRCPTASSTRSAAAMLLTVFYGVAMAVGSGLDADGPAGDVPGRGRVRRWPPSCCCSPRARRTTLALVLAVQGLCTLGWAWRTGRAPARADEDEASPRRLAARCRPAGARRVGRRRVGRAGRRRVVLAARGRRTADRRRAPAAARAPPGRRGGRACWSPRCRRPCSP